jgi:uncharacterized protein YndB with AHSA1/START domain
MKDYIVKKEIAIRAHPAVVWDALTNPDKTKEYFFNCKVISDWEEGSPITFKGKMFFFIPFEMKGRIIRVLPRRLLQYTLKNDSDGESSNSVVTDELSYEKGITTLTITDDVGSGEEAESRYKKSMKGWDKVLKGLKDLLEAERAPSMA